MYEKSVKNRFFKNDLYDKIRHNHLYNEEEIGYEEKKSMCITVCSSFKYSDNYTCDGS